MLFCRARLLAHVLYVLVATTVAMTVVQQQPAASALVLRGAADQQQPAECRLEIEGSQRGGISNASMECSVGQGATVGLLVNEQLLGKFKKGFLGVTWPQGKRSDCLLTVVGATRATFFDSRVEGVRGDLVPGLKHIVCVAGTSKVQLLDSTIFNNTGTGLAVFDGAGVTLNASILESNTAKYGAAGMLVSGNATARITQESSIAKNVALNNITCGGVGVEDNASLLVDGKSVIMSNKALSPSDERELDTCGGVGGSGNASITISGSTIGNNTAAGAGVVISESASLLITDGSMFSGNGPAAVNGAAGAVVAKGGTVNITGGTMFVSNRPATFVSDKLGLRANETAIVEALQFGQFFNARDVVIFPTATLHMDESVRSDNTPLNMCSKSVGWISLPTGDLTPDMSQIRLSWCPAGAFPAGILFCECCPASKFSFDANITANDCHSCPEHAVCPGANQVTTVPGYWKSAAKSVQLHACQNPAACDGTQCQAGYQGNLCGSCAEGYGMTLPFRCAKCRALGQQLGLYFLLASATYIFVVGTVHCTLKDNLQADTSVRPSDFIKVLVQYLQWLVILGSIAAPWRNEQVLRTLFLASSVVFGAATGQALSIDCWLPLLRLSRPPLAIQRQLVNFLAPVVLVIGVAVAFALLCAVSGLSRRRRARATTHGMQRFLHMLPTILIVVVFYAYPTLITAGMSFFACLRIDDASKGLYPQYAALTHAQGYWVLDMSQECYVGWHKAWAFGLGLPVTLLLCGGVPIGLLWLLLGNKSRLTDKSFRGAFGFLYRNYTKGKVWWEVVWALQTVLLTCVSVFHYTIKSYYAIVLLSVLFVASAVLQAVAKPYAERQLHRLHLASSGCLFLTAQCMLMLFDVPGYAVSSEAAPAVAIFVVIINTAFVLWCCVAILVRIKNPAGGACKRLIQLVRTRLAGRVVP